MDGSYAQIVGNGFSPKLGQCVIYSVSSKNYTQYRQIQVGLLRCNGIKLTGSCPGGRTFIERYNGSTYICNPGYTFTNNTAYDATSYRKSSTSTVLTGHVNGVSAELGGYGLSHAIHAAAWGEATGGYSCPAPSKGTFNAWKKYGISAGWTPITGSTVRRAYGYGSERCWPTVSGTAADGGFHVD